MAIVLPLPGCNSKPSLAFHALQQMSTWDGDFRGVCALASPSRKRGRAAVFALHAVAEAVFGRQLCAGARVGCVDVVAVMNAPVTEVALLVSGALCYTALAWQFAAWLGAAA